MFCQTFSVTLSQHFLNPALHTRPNWIHTDYFKDGATVAQKVGRLFTNWKVGGSVPSSSSLNVESGTL